MFAVFNDGRLSSKGPIETLYNVKKINEANEINNDKQSNESNQFTVPTQNAITKEASLAYKRNANLDTREVIYHVSQIMNKEIFYVNSQTTVEETYNILYAKNIRQLPIIDEGGKIKGMVSQKDILDLIINDIEHLSHSIKKTLNDLILPDVIATDPITDIRRVAKVMTDFNLNAMPIVNDDEILVGIVSRTDILRTVASVPPMQLWA